MNAELHDKVIALLQEAQNLLESASETEKELVWWKSCSSGIWWLSSCVGCSDDALYSDTGPTYYPDCNDTWTKLSSEEEQFPLETRIGMIIMHAKLNNIKIPPFPWHKL